VPDGGQDEHAAAVGAAGSAQAFAIHGQGSAAWSGGLLVLGAAVGATLFPFDQPVRGAGRGHTSGRLIQYGAQVGEARHADLGGVE
jgi:hypothetical protein